MNFFEDIATYSIVFCITVIIVTKSDIVELSYSGEIYPKTGIGKATSTTTPTP